MRRIIRHDGIPGFDAGDTILGESGLPLEIFHGLRGCIAIIGCRFIRIHIAEIHESLLEIFDDRVDHTNRQIHRRNILYGAIDRHTRDGRKDVSIDTKLGDRLYRL